MTESFDVFLSHNSKDKPAIRELAEALRARGLNVWLDEWELVPGRPWLEALEKVIETTRASAVLVGKDGLGPWEDAEMRGCLSEFVKRKLPVIPVLLPGAPAMPTLPFFLKRFTWVDLRGGITQEGIDQLQWGITGRRPDRPKLSSDTAPEAATKTTLSEVQPASTEVRPALGNEKPATTTTWEKILRKVRPTPNHAVVSVFFATNRAETGNLTARDRFGPGRGSITYGNCFVSIPRDHRMGELEAPSVFSLRFRWNPGDHVTLLEGLRILSNEEFLVKSHRNLK